MDEIKNGSEEKTTEQICTKSQRVPRKAQHVKKLNSFHFNQNPLPYAPCAMLYFPEIVRLCKNNNYSRL
jgi:hypothetical protein